MNGSAGCVPGLYRHGHERRLGDGRGEADGGGECVDRQIVQPVDTGSEILGSNVFGRGELAGHGFAYGEERVLEAYEEQRKPNQDEAGAGCYFSQVRRLTAENDDLKQQENHDDGSDVEGGGDQGVGEGAGEVGHEVTIP